MWHHPLMTKNQITGSISLDVSSLADAIVERLQQPAGSGLVEVPSADAASIVSPALSAATGLYDWKAASDLAENLRDAGYVLAKLPATPAAPSWFDRSSD